MAENKSVNEPEMSEAEAVKIRADAIRAASSNEQDVIPAPLLKSVLTELLLAAAVAIVSIVFAVYFKRLSYATPLLLAAYLVYQAISVLMDWKNEKVKERVLLCTSVARSVLGVHVVMQSTEAPETEAVSLHDFYYKRKSVCPFREGYLYVIYIHGDQPNRVLAWKAT